MSGLGNPKKPPLPYPDNVKLIKRTVLGSVGYMVVALLLGIAVTLVLGPRRPQWVNIALAVAVPCGLLAVLVWVGRSWQKEDLQRQRDLQRLRTGTEVAPAPDANLAKPRRRRVLHFVLMLGLPLTIVGAVSSIPGLLIGGLVMLVAQLIDNAVVLPFLRSRRRHL